MKKLFYEVKMSNGETWRVPLSLIEHSIESHYGSIPDYMSYRGHLKSESAEDWAKNNMFWSEVKDHAELVHSNADLDYEDYWCNGEGCIV